MALSRAKRVSVAVPDALNQGDYAIAPPARHHDAVTWPLAARAAASDAAVDMFIVREFHQGLKEVGFVEGENVAVEYHWAESLP